MNALVAEVVDALDLKSNQAHPWCRFKSGSRHFKTSLDVFFFLFELSLALIYDKEKTFMLFYNIIISGIFLNINSCLNEPFPHK